MKIIRRSRLFVLLPNLILYVLVMNLIWDLININLNSAVAKHWPWRFNLLDISTCATLAGIIASIILARAQFAKSIRPAIGWSGDEDMESDHLSGSTWTVRLHNYGPGRCQMRKIEFSYALTDQSPSGWKTWEAITGELAGIGIKRNRDYFLKNIGIGSTVPITTRHIDDVELAAFTRECLAKLSVLDIAIEVEDVLGDIYARTIECLYSAHQMNEFKSASTARTNRFRKRRPS